MTESGRLQLHLGRMRNIPGGVVAGHGVVNSVDLCQVKVLCCGEVTVGTERIWWRWHCACRRCTVVLWYPKVLCPPGMRPHAQASEDVVPAALNARVSHWSERLQAPHHPL